MLQLVQMRIQRQAKYKSGVDNSPVGQTQPTKGFQTACIKYGFYISKWLGKNQKNYNILWHVKRTWNSISAPIHKFYWNTAKPLDLLTILELQ